MKNVSSPSVHTKLAFLLGQPLGHSLSPAMHNRAFQLLGLDYLYLPVEVTAEDLETVFKGLCKMNVAGFNVTIPHKVAIMEFLDTIDPLAQKIGAVNTICISSGRTVGHNTDGYGFIQSLKENGGIDPTGKQVVLIGAGGAARAIGMTLADMGVEKIRLANRTREKAEHLAEQINSVNRPCAEVVDLQEKEMENVLAQSQILVNSTSLGMSPAVDTSPVPARFLHRHLVVADIVYNPLTTRLLREAETAGCVTVPGPGMLIHQGAAALRLWTGKEPPVQAMSEVIYNHLGNSAKALSGSNS